MSEGPAADAHERVLIVDADVAFARTLADDFRARGFAVECAADRAGAEAAFAAAPPDVVVLDLYLPEGAAVELLRAWKQTTPPPAIVLVSSQASLSYVVDALNEGARRFFTKPVSAATLLDELRVQKTAELPLPDNHLLCTAALGSDGADRFFALFPGLLCVAGFDGRFKLLNPAWEKLLGYSIAELCARPQLELVHVDDRQKSTDESCEINGGHTVFRFKNRYCCKDGTYRWLDWSAMCSPFHKLIYASARDVTKRVHMEQGLRRHNEELKAHVTAREALLHETRAQNRSLTELGRAKDDITAMIIHDLKNPLSVILSNYEYVLEGFEGAADCVEALQDSRDAGRRMLRLLGNLGDVARLESGVIEVAKTEVSLSELVRVVAEQRRVLAGSRGVEIVVVGGPNVDLEIDAELTTRTLENIFDNALRFAPAGGIIEVELRREGGEVELRIGNSGPAIPAPARQVIFEKYRQAEVESGRMNLGLGLYFCRLATEAQRGRIWVEETARLPTVFALRFPSRARDDVAPRQTLDTIDTI